MNDTDDTFRADVVSTIVDVRTTMARVRGTNRHIGLVPTMGALHEGHLSLIRQMRAVSDYVVVTIFVNPTQFAPEEDLDRYPRPFERDVELASGAGADLIFAPQVEAMYRPEAETHVEVQRLSKLWEGEHRPTHFRGVTTVVLKLLNITQPDLAIFGAKDYQQQLLIRRMCLDLDVPVRILTGETIREPDGLALSSRNRYLSPGERQTALRISESLAMAQAAITGGETDLEAVRHRMRDHLEGPDLRLDYATIVDGDSLEELKAPAENMVALVAAHVGTTRLIDNRRLQTK